jgi:methionyl-tRNA formyltransferase
MKKIPRIVFFGTTDFAAAQLQTLAIAHANIAMVVTTPDNPAGRKLMPQPSPVKRLALTLGLPTTQPINLRDTEFLAALRSIAADIFVVVAFRMLPREVWSLPAMGTFNLHASLLPQYRGAAPINWAIINGETQTGVTTFLIDAGMDTGQLLLQKTIPIDAEDDASTLGNKMMRIAGDAITETIDGLCAKTLAPRQQPSDMPLKTAPKLFRNNTILNPMLEVAAALNFIRGLSPSPAAWMQVRVGEERPQSFKIYSAQAVDINIADSPVGTLTASNGMLLLRVQNGYINLLQVQLEGKKRMAAADFLRGLRGTLTLTNTIPL